MMGAVLAAISGWPAAIRAGMWMTGAMVSFTCMAISGRALADRLDTFEIMTYRSIIGIVIVLVVAKCAGTMGQITTRRMGLHIIRNLFHFTGQNLWFFAVIYVPLSQLFVFEFSTPLWVAAFAPLFLAERLTLTRFAAAAVGFVGILVVVRPDFSALPPEIIAAALCAVGFAGATIATKLLTRTETVTCILFWLVMWQALFGLVMAGYDGQMAFPSGAEWGWVSLIGVCGLCAHFCITSALQLAPATVVTPFEFLRLPMVSVVGVWLYNEGLEWQVFAGALVVLWANWLNIRAETSAKPKLR
ncbi:EamA-like transporter family [SAR116 cluster alpha proteobacterium HIMB100]|nr:EamA-like transporter family [SAR116 cluster alpha proteobacterium HIMB100]